MPDTNDIDIDALQAQLMKAREDEGWFITGDQAKDFSRALTALVAERNELASRCKAHEDMLRDDLSKKQKQYDESSQTINMLHDLFGWADDGEKRIVVSVIEERDALRKRVAELEARAKPVYITDGQRVERIDLREVAVYSATAADLTLAAMRKGEA